MKQLLFILLIMLLITSLQLDAQNCIDTVHIKGYYVVQRIAWELTPQITRKGKVTVIKQLIDRHSTSSFIPCDSITKEHPLSYWLNHFFDKTKQVFISCERIGLKYIAHNCPDVSNALEKDTCLFPLLKSNVLYKTINLNTGDVFEIYYLDAYWARIKINKESVEASMIPSRFAQTGISPDIQEFNLYYFVKYDSVQMSPDIEDPNIMVWEK